ncbi:SEC14-like protein 2 [Orchesella cincta]|uniref:SEC14-like protein 2 n=1 Tax=Orchesella cincta TaxID=48709 RepID=A0A1D2MMM1_ORCCI|nr:SEC14-like protein 2 [Orchesella cincta]
MEKYTLISVSGAIILLLAVISHVSAISVSEELQLTPEQRMMLDKFKAMVSSKLEQDYMKDDIYLLRWLRAKDYDVKEADKLLNENLRWRKEKNMDTIHQEDWSDMTKDYPYHIGGFDKENRPLGTVSIRDWDIRKTALQGKLPRLQRYMDKLMDEISMKVVRLRSEGMNVTRWVLLTNVEGFNVVQHACSSCTPLWVNFLRSYEMHFPGTADSIIAINAPETFNLLLRLLKPSIPAASRETVKILGTNKKAWMANLDEIISRDQRTKEYGGTKEYS